MEIGTAEISRIIKEQIRDYEKTVEIQEIGTVLSTGDGIARIHGLDKVAAGELLEFPHNIFGIALNLEEDNVGAALFGETHMIKEGDTVKRTGRIAEVPVPTRYFPEASSASFVQSSIYGLSILWLLFIYELHHMKLFRQRQFESLSGRYVGAVAPEKEAH